MTFGSDILIMDQRTPSDYDRLKLRRHIEKIRKLCCDVLEGYSSHCQEMYGHPVRQHNLDKIRLLYEQRIERRCAEYNLTILEEKQWEEPPNLKIGDDVDSGEESEEHDSDVVNIYTSMMTMKKMMMMMKNTNLSKNLFSLNVTTRASALVTPTTLMIRKICRMCSYPQTKKVRKSSCLSSHFSLITTVRTEIANIHCIWSGHNTKSSVER